MNIPIEHDLNGWVSELLGQGFYIKSKLHTGGSKNMAKGMKMESRQIYDVF